MTPTVRFWAIVTFVFGVMIGSFLNAVIYRLPRNLSLLNPKKSICPNCRHELSALDLVPLFSFLFLGRRCRYCKTPISWRYFNGELLTGLLFTLLYLHYSQPQDAPNCIALLAFAAVLIPVFFIDLETYSIPDSLNLLLLLIAVARDGWGILHHEPGHALLWGWLPPSLLGAVAGIVIIGGVRVAGWLWKRVEAMGLGDVLLARGMGAMLVSVVPPGTGALHLLRLCPIWIMSACLFGIVAYPIDKAIRKRTEQAASVAVAEEPLEEEKPSLTEEEEPDSPARQLLDIGYCFWLGDLVDYVQIRTGRKPVPPPAVDDGFQAAPTAIPFGPSLVLGFLATVFFGDPITAAYLAYAFRKS